LSPLKQPGKSTGIVTWKSHLRSEHDEQTKSFQQLFMRFERCVNLRLFALFLTLALCDFLKGTKTRLIKKETICKGMWTRDSARHTSLVNMASDSLGLVLPSSVRNKLSKFIMKVCLKGKTIMLK